MATNPVHPWVRKLILRRSGGYCERCGLEPGTNIHHRQARGMGGTKRLIHSPEWLLHLCGSGTTGCHGYIESHPSISYSKGWKLRRSHTAATPVQTAYGWVVLNPDGTTSPHHWADNG